MCEKRNQLTLRCQAAKTAHHIIERSLQIKVKNSIVNYYNKRKDLLLCLFMLFLFIYQLISFII